MLKSQPFEAADFFASDPPFPKISVQERRSWGNYKIGT